MRHPMLVFLTASFLVVWSVGSLGFARVKEKPASGSWKAAELKSALSKAGSGSRNWQIAGSAADAKLLSRLGTTDLPLQVEDSRGRVAAEVYRVEEAGKYRGFVLLHTADSSDLRSEFFTRTWPLDRLAASLKTADLDDPLKEPRMRLVMEEDRLVLWVNLGKVERQFEFMRFDPKENHRREARR